MRAGAAAVVKDVGIVAPSVFEGVTDGTPISILFRNADQRSGDYSDIKDKYRPGHADFTFDAKFGLRDYRGGGRSSARETVCRVAAGAVAQVVGVPADGAVHRPDTGSGVDEGDLFEAMSIANAIEEIRVPLVDRMKILWALWRG